MKRQLNGFRTCILIAALFFACTTTAMGQTETAPEIPEQKVKFAHAPYIDTSAAFIGMEKGWFEEVGVIIEDRTLFTPIENAASFIASGSADVVDAGLVQILPSMNTIPDVRVFTHHDIFQGQAIMGQAQYKTVDDFVSEGKSLEEAIKNAVAQMKGKTILLAPDPASSNFARVFLGAGGLELSDANVITSDYRQHLPLMLAGRADFENGGGPTIIQMLKNNFRQVIQTKHLIELIDPTKDISSLTSIVLNGYVASNKFIESNYPTVLRMASVNYRIADYIAKHPDEAAAMHAPFLNRYGGSQLDAKDVVLLYTQIDPFFGFDAQAEWYHNESSPYYWKHWVQAVIESSEKQGVISPGQWTPETIELSHQVYKDLEGYRDEARSLLDQHSSQIEAKGGKAAEFLNAARGHFEIFNYYDAARFAKEAVALLQAQ